MLNLRGCDLVGAHVSLKEGVKLNRNYSGYDEYSICSVYKLRKNSDCFACGNFDD